MARVKVLPREERSWSGGGLSVVDGKAVGGASWCYGGSQDFNNSRNIVNIRIYRLEMEKVSPENIPATVVAGICYCLPEFFEETGDIERE